jgi:hypothetical protein
MKDRGEKGGKEGGAGPPCYQLCSTLETRQYNVGWKACDLQKLKWILGSRWND